MNTTKLQSQQAELEQKIIDLAKLKNLSNANVEPILDGIVNINEYCKAKKKILWILKEPYDDINAEGKPNGGGWSLSSLISENPQHMATTSNVFKRIAYISFGVLNNTEWKKMDYIQNDSSIAESLKSIAYINVGKMPNLSKTPDDRLKEIYSTWKEILFEQIKTYEAAIIIFGNTFKVFAEDIFPDGVSNHKIISRKGKDFVGVYNYNGSILIDAYHPSALFSDDDYIETILEVLLPR